MGYELNSRKLEELKDINRKLGVATRALGLVVVAMLLTAVLVLLGVWLILRSNEPQTSTATMVILPLISQAEVASTQAATPHAMELQCFRAERSFVRGSSKECDGTGACNWTIGHFKRVDGDNLAESLTAAALGGSVTTFVVAGHDRARVVPGRRLDSNFELASLRARHVAAHLEAQPRGSSNAATGNAAPLVPLPIAQLPQMCLPQGEAKMSDAIRRSPALLILSRTDKP